MNSRPAVLIPLLFLVVAGCLGGAPAEPASTAGDPAAEDMDATDRSSGPSRTSSWWNDTVSGVYLWYFDVSVDERLREAEGRDEHEVEVPQNTTRLWINLTFDSNRNVRVNIFPPGCGGDIAVGGGTCWSTIGGQEEYGEMPPRSRMWANPEAGTWTLDAHYNANRTIEDVGVGTRTVGFNVTISQLHETALTT